MLKEWRMVQVVPMMFMDCIKFIMILGIVPIAGKRSIYLGYVLGGERECN